MAVVSVTKLSELGGAKRIDAEYYQPEYLALEREIMSTHFPVSRVSELSNFVRKGIFDLSPEFYRQEGVPFVRVQNIGSGFLDEAELEFIPIEIHQSEVKTELEAHDLVLSKVGTIGEVSIISSKYNKANFSQNVIGIKVDKYKMLPGYLLSFLLSRYGRLQISRIQMPQVQSKLELKDIRCLKIIRLPSLEQETHKRVLEAEALYERAKLLYFQAENLLLEELRLESFRPKYELSYRASLSKAFGVHRVDAEYFQPSYDAIESHLESNFHAVPIRKINFVEVTTGQYCEEYVSKLEGAPYIRGVDISNGTIRMDDLVYIASKNQYPNKKAIEGDVIATRVGTIGLSARIPKECEGGTISDNLIRLRINNDSLNSYYLALFLGSPIGISLMIRNSRGSVQQRLNQETLKEVIVPILPDQTQQEIASLVRQSHEARNKSKQLLEESKSKVENLIEGKA